ncbi:MAG: PAS domain S-box protein [Mariprofundales bacterium]|nr:PAS domain S-box protein [Mariprofundales bacterium]
MANQHEIILNQAPIRWELDEGRMSFFDIPAITFWLDPSLLRILQPLREEVGDELYRLIIAHQASIGTEEDYQQMVTQLGSHFEEGFLAWGAAVAAAGWGRFEILAFNLAKKTAMVRVTHPWELQMFESQPQEDAWGCPFLMGKIIGIFSHALGESCWADERNIILTEGESAVDFHIYASDLTIADELDKLRGVRRKAREAQLVEEIRQHQQAETSLRNLASNFAAISGAEFFSKVTHYLAGALDLDCVFIAELIAGEDRANAVGGYARGEALPLPFTYTLKETPYENVVKEQFCFYPSGVQAQFPKDTLLKEMGVDSYIGITLCDKDGHVLGLIVGLSGKPLNSLDLAESLFKVFSSRIAVELERKQADEKLKESEIRYRTLFETSSDAIMLRDDTGFVDCNQATLDMFGWDSIADINRNLSELSPELQPCGSDSRVLADTYIATAFKNGGYQFEWVHKRMDGSEFPAEIWLSPMTLDGKPVMQARVRDISIRRRDEESLRKLSSAIEQAGESVLITDKAGIIEYVNPAFVKITGYSAEEAIGQTPRILKSGNHDATFYASMWQSISRGCVWHGKVIDKRKDGSYFPAMLTISSILNENDEITHFVGLHADLTEQENLEQQFYQAQKMEAIGTLVGGIAHDFNNILAGMTGNLYLAKQRVKNDPDILNKLTTVEQLSMRAADMIAQLLTFARKGIIRMKAMPLTPLIKESMKFLRTSTPENIAMHEYICSDTLPIKGDATQLHQVLMNLINNACDAVEGVDDPCITIRLKMFSPDKDFAKAHPDATAASYVHLSVEDNGCGIPKPLHEHLFEPFFTTKEQGKGTGLGLSMVYGAITSHHGFVELDSAPNKGAAFHIYLPLLEQQQASELTTPAQTEASAGHGELILLADDECCVRETTAEVLEMLGYEVLEATDGLKALELCEKRRDDISLALLDVVMPHCGGMQLAEKIRAFQPDMPVIFMTGYDKQHVLGGDAPLANSEILTKPVNFDDLSHRIRQLLGDS